MLIEKERETESDRDRERHTCRNCVENPHFNFLIIIALTDVKNLIEYKYPEWDVQLLYIF